MKYVAASVVIDRQTIVTLVHALRVNEITGAQNQS